MPYFVFVQNDIEVKKDTERADEIRALKRAWESAEEGRAVKVSFYVSNIWWGKFGLPN